MDVKLNRLFEIFQINSLSQFKTFIASDNFKHISKTGQVLFIDIGTSHYKLIEENQSKILDITSIDILYFEKKSTNIGQLFNVDFEKFPFLKELDNIKQISVVPIILQKRLKYLIIILNISIKKDEFILLSKIINLIFQNIFSENIVEKRTIFIDKIFSKLSSTIMVRDKNYNIILSNKKFNNDKFKCYDVAFGFNEKCSFCSLNKSEITKKINKKYFKISHSFIYPYFLCIVDDITSIIELKQELSKSEKLSFLGKISSEITHEIKNPLNSIKLKIALLEKLIKSNDTKVLNILRNIDNEIDRLSNLVNDFLQFGRNINLKFEKINLKNIIEEILYDFREIFKKENIFCKVTTDSNNFYITGDAAKIKQVFLNLINNSVEALNNIKKERKLLIEVKKNVKFIKIIFKDNGPGVNEPDKLFTPFYTTKNLGTGLGLVVAKENLKLHNADIKYIRKENFTIFEIIFKI